MFAIIISEKGGAERRDTFDKDEISIGRVQGNDVMLPKGNVSKKHARLVYRDGRFIVSDLNSTNGTYVNRRRISQATIVREGDRVYVGDFVLRVEVPAGASSQAVSGGATEQPTASASAPHGSRPAEHPPERESGEADVMRARVPGAPKLPSGQQVPSTGRDVVPGGGRPAPRAARPAGAAPSIPAAPQATPSRRGRTSTAPELEVQYEAVAVLVDRVSGALEEGRAQSPQRLAQRIERELEVQLTQLRKEGTVPAGLPAEQLARDARAALTNLGPLESLIEDDEVTEITVIRFDHVVAMRSGRYVVADAPFESELALRNAVSVLCLRSGTPLRAGERVVERALPGGERLWAVVEPLAVRGPLLVIRRPRRVGLSLDDLIRGGSLSRPMAEFLSLCVSGRVNLLVVGSCDTGGPAVTCALTATASDSRMVAVQDVDDIASSSTSVTVLSTAGMRSEAGALVRTAVRVPGARLIVELATADMVEATVEAIGAGADGVIALLRAASVRSALGRLPAEVATVRTGLHPSAARQWIASSFAVLLEVRRLSDRRYRVTRIAEITGATDREITAEDIFRFELERVSSGAVEGSFVATGTVPRAADEIAARGLKVDRELFKRG